MAIVVEQEFFGIDWGVADISIALDQPANRRDIEAWVGDEFTVVAKIFVKDGDANPLTTFTGRAVTMLIGHYYTPPASSIVGIVQPVTGKVRFNLAGIDWSRYWGRVPYTIKLTESDRARTIAQGYVVIYGNDCPGYWPNDYGFWRGW